MQAGAFPSLQRGKFIIFSGTSLIEMKKETDPMAEQRWETRAGLGSGGFCRMTCSQWHYWEGEALVSLS